MSKFAKIILISFMVSLVSCLKDSVVESEPAGHEHSKTEVYYTCSMHPQVRENEPGKCPICHMNLTKVEVEKGTEPKQVKEEVQKELYQCKDFPDVTSEVAGVCPIDGTPMIPMIRSKAAKVVAKLKLRKAQLHHFKPEVFPVTSMKMSKNIRLLGSVLQSEEKESSIPARINGRVEKVYVKSTGSFIKAGDLVLELYSPKLIAAGEEYLLARKSYLKNKSNEFKDLMNQSEERLKLWGIQKAQIESWYKNSEVPRQIKIYSDSTGIVQKRSAIVGKYFKEGQNFFELSDLSDVWVELDVYEQDSGVLKLGQRVEMEFNAIPGDIQKGEIDFISPVLDQTTRTLKVRTTIKNSLGRLKPGMIASATLKLDFEGMPLVVPRSAVIDTGKRKVVWVQSDERSYQAKTILTGVESEGYVEVKEGLIENEKVVVEGSFLLDAQAQLFGGYEDFNQSGESK
ncbi:efflux RND transporter periplasmic adaptor subunit [Halobacteriovorax sp. GB3]|uniref:efflux RND transporter periplasmic adaptor subunit n=1 Tax=Halobacteriovorax sp. GB3 TaxID=2719615 RepID=UPI002362D618|nr:efflux RND transporter periplasmic adaptor subunit [Halobacteriovorax sp. GB3]MDD0851742.1 efflux RND transporter periplasmic adaptor subunit [Halobacteriovorax sp. GB3]